MAIQAVRAGDFNRRISIQHRVNTPDGFGQGSPTWTELIACWARLEPLSGHELLAAQAVNSEVTHLVEIFYRPTVTAAMRVVYQGRIFSIQSVIDPDTAHVTLQMLCSEGLNEG